MFIYELVALIAALAAGSLGLALLMPPATLWIIIPFILAIPPVGSFLTVRVHPQSTAVRAGEMLGMALLPTLLTAGVVPLLAMTTASLVLAVEMLTYFIALNLVLLAQYFSLEESQRRRTWSRHFLAWSSYGIALTLYLGIWLQGSLLRDASFGLLGSVSPDIVNGLVALVLAGVTLLLGWEQYLRNGGVFKRALLHAGVCGLIVGEASWIIGYWPMNEVVAALVLLLVFYLVTGLTQHHFTGLLRRSVVLEYLAVFAAGFLVLFISQTW